MLLGMLLGGLGTTKPTANLAGNEGTTAAITSESLAAISSGVVR
jgi:hypothetical protein